MGFLLDRPQCETQAERKISETLPYFVGDKNIKAQQIVCQEKNAILEIILPRVLWIVQRDLIALSVKVLRNAERTTFCSYEDEP